MVADSPQNLRLITTGYQSHKFTQRWGSKSREFSHCPPLYIPSCLCFETTWYTWYSREDTHKTAGCPVQLNRGLDIPLFELKIGKLLSWESSWKTGRNPHSSSPELGYPSPHAIFMLSQEEYRTFERWIGQSWGIQGKESQKKIPQKFTKNSPKIHSRKTTAVWTHTTSLVHISLDHTDPNPLCTIFYYF